MGGRMTTKLDRAINFLCLLHPVITRTEGEIINSNNNINTNNSNDYNIYNDRQSYNITTITTISIPSTKNHNLRDDELIRMLGEMKKGIKK
jgi:hypothetical protein